MNFFVSLVGLLLCLCSCNRNKNTIEYNMKKLYGMQFVLPSLDDWIFYGQDSAWMKHLNPELKLIVYYDSTVCTTCKISQLWDWKKVVNYAKEKKYQFQPFFILSPPKELLGEIHVALEKYPFEWPVYIDSERKFSQLNPSLPENSFFHIFLLDENDKIILVGDPLLKEELWKLYQKKIDTILAN